MNKANFVIGALVLTFGSMAIADKIAYYVLVVLGV